MADRDDFSFDLRFLRHLLRLSRVIVLDARHVVSCQVWK
jgi:hypothetical protein